MMRGKLAKMRPKRPKAATERERKGNRAPGRRAGYGPAGTRGDQGGPVTETFRGTGLGKTEADPGLCIYKREIVLTRPDPRGVGGYSRYRNNCYVTILK